MEWKDRFWYFKRHFLYTSISHALSYDSLHDASLVNLGCKLFWKATRELFCSTTETLSTILSRMFLVFLETNQLYCMEAMVKHCIDTHNSILTKWSLSWFAIQLFIWAFFRISGWKWEPDSGLNSKTTTDFVVYFFSHLLLMQLASITHEKPIAIHGSVIRCRLLIMLFVRKICPSAMYIMRCCCQTYTCTISMFCIDLSNIFI